MPSRPFADTWRIIVWMSVWDQDCVDMDDPGHITFGAGRSGELQGQLYFHLGDDSAFRAVPQPRSACQCTTAK